MRAPGGTMRAAILAGIVAASSGAGCLGERPTPLDAGGSAGSAGSDGTGGGMSGTGGAPGTGGMSGRGGSGGSDGRIDAGSTGGYDAGSTGGYDAGSTGGYDAGSLTDRTASSSDGSDARPLGNDAGTNDASLDGTTTDGGTTLTDAPSEAPPLVPTKLVFTMQPTSGYAQQPLAPFQVAIADQNNATVTAATDTITVSISANPGGANLLGYLTAPTVNGVATFDTVGLDQPGTGYNLVAISGSGSPQLRGSSQSFNVKQPPFTRVTTGLFGGIVKSVAVSNGTNPTLYAGTPAGVFKSTNNGSTWTFANFGNSGEADLVVVDPRNPANVYITSSLGSGSSGFGGFFFAGKSTNGGDAWRSIGDDVQEGQIGSFVIDPRNPAILYAGGPLGLYRSTTAGDTWTKTAFGFACYALTIDPITPTTLYAYAYDQTNFAPKGIYKSIDSGATWNPVNNPVLTMSDLDITGLFATPTGVFAATNTNMFRSIDGGASWAAATAPGWMVAYAPSSVQRVYLGRGTGVQVSNDGGTTFGTAVTTVGGRLNGLAVDPNNANVVYAATDAGVFVSSDGGVSFTFSSIGMGLLNVGAIAMNPGTPSTIYAGGPAGIYRTTDSATTWATTPMTEPITALAIDPANTRIIYACTQSAGFYRSTDLGTTWGARVDTGGNLYCYSIVVRGQTIWLPTVGGGVRRSTNGGTSFGATSLTAPTYAIAADPTGNIVYAGTNAGTYKSIDGGVTWNPMLPTDLANAMLVDPVTSSTVYAGMSCGTGAGGATGSGGFRRSTDSGGTWEPVVSGPCVNALYGLASGTLFAVGRGGTPFAVTMDHGQTWAPSGLGLTGEPLNVTAASDGLTVYVGTSLGLYKSTTGGM